MQLILFKQYQTFKKFIDIFRIDLSAHVDIEVTPKGHFPTEIFFSIIIPIIFHDHGTKVLC